MIIYLPLVDNHHGFFLPTHGAMTCVSVLLERAPLDVQ